MKTTEEINIQKREDVKFILSAVTTELHEMAYLNYFETWEGNGGMGWFFWGCVDITEAIMLTEGSQYLKWLDVWIANEDKYCESFSEVTGEACFDWYHMNEARKMFESRYSKDECNKEQVSESIGRLINMYDTEADRGEIMNLSVKFAKKKREEYALAKIVQDLRKINANADTITEINRRLFN